MKNLATRALGPKWLSGYAGGWTLGTLVGIATVLLFIFGKLRVRGYRCALSTAMRGKLIVAANHPEGLSPFLMSGIFFPWFLFFPRLLFWNMSRERLVPSWALGMLRCILVDRGDRIKKSEALSRVLKIVADGGNILVFAEGTRTIDPDNLAEFREKNGRKLRRIRTGVPMIARYAKARIMPVWIDVPDITVKLGPLQTLTHLFFAKKRRMIISFGEPYAVREKWHGLAAENEFLEDRILAS